MKKLTTEDFVRRAKEIHGDKYDYSLVEYRGSQKSVRLICPVHGEFEMLAYNHTNNRAGCRPCGLRRVHDGNRVGVEEFLSRWGNPQGLLWNGDAFRTLRDRVTVTCPKHGVIETTPADLLKLNGCRRCSTEARVWTHEQFVEKARSIHGADFRYGKERYEGSHTPMTVECRKHGPFEIKPYVHLNGSGCPECHPFRSVGEKQIVAFVRSLGLEVSPNDKRFPGVREVDLFLPDRSIAVEYDGLYWHSDAYRSDDYHLRKTEAVEAEGCRLIHIFEDEWREPAKRRACQARLRSILGQNERKVGARSTKVVDLDSKTSRAFLAANHLQGDVNASVRIGLEYENRIVAVATFGRLRRSLGSGARNGHFELYRFCSEPGTTVQGGASKLLRHFVRSRNPIRVVSYADRRWSDGRVYEAVGFRHVGLTQPGYYYTRGWERKHRYAFRKSVLVSEGADPQFTERQIMSARGWNRIYDCGHIRFEWTRPSD